MFFMEGARGASDNQFGVELGYVWRRAEWGNCDGRQGDPLSVGWKQKKSVGIVPHYRSRLPSS